MARPSTHPGSSAPPPGPAVGAPDGADRTAGFRVDVAVLAGLALVVRLPALLAPRHLSYDDGVFGMSAVEIAGGFAPFRDVFSPQGPLHLVTVALGDRIGFHAAGAPRVAAVAAGVLAAVCTYGAARRLGSRWGAQLAGALVALSGGLLWTTGPITADGIALAFGLAGFWAACAYREEPSVARAAVTGLLVGASFAVKPLLLGAGVATGLLVLSRRRPRDLVVAAVLVPSVWVLAALPWGIADVWDQSIAYHLEGRRYLGVGDAAVKVVRTLGEREWLLLAVLVVFAVAAVVGVRRGEAFLAHARADRFALLAVVAWIAVTALLLVTQKALWRNHVAHLVAPLALLVALRPPPRRAVAVAVVVAAPLWFLGARDVVAPGDYTGDDAAVVAWMRDLPDDAQVISDEPGLVWRAGRRTPPELVDSSIKLIDQGRLTAGDVADAAARDGVCAVVATSRRFGEELPDLPERLAAVGYREIDAATGAIVVYARPCRQARAG